MRVGVLFPQPDVPRKQLFEISAILPSGARFPLFIRSSWDPSWVNSVSATLLGVSIVEVTPVYMNDVEAGLDWLSRIMERVAAEGEPITSYWAEPDDVTAAALDMCCRAQWEIASEAE